MKQMTLTIFTILALALPLIAASTNDIPASPFNVTVMEPVLNQSRTDEPTDCIELMFVIDDTGSMGGAINNIKLGLANLLQTAMNVSNGNLRAGVMTFKDQVTVNLPLTSNMTDVTNAINALFASGGTGWPEASDVALHELGTIGDCVASGDFNPMSWSEDCCKIAILVTDAPPAGCDDAFGNADILSANAAAQALASMGVKIGSLLRQQPSSDINPIYYSDPDAEPIMINYAITTGGLFGLIEPDGSNTSMAIEQVILDCAGISTETELCCTTEGCTTVLAGTCDEIGGTVVNSCDDCDPVSNKNSSWGAMKALYR
jgi:uncharacterized protein YegL